MVILGGGYAVPVLEPLGWLAGLDVVYWGDIDTHGFAILNRLRHHLPHARSMLMDRATLLDHRDHWVTEPSPTAAALDRLDRPSQLSTPTSSRIPTPRPSASSKNASASRPSKRPWQAGEPGGHCGQPQGGPPRTGRVLRPDRPRQDHPGALTAAANQQA